jgi:circadian clock protein KaiC
MADQTVIVGGLAKCPTGISGLDDLTGGGLPRGRPTLVCGSAGCGKTVLSMEFLVRGAVQYQEPGVFVSFEETLQELTANFASLGFDLADLAARKLLAIEHIYVERSEIEETGEYNLEGLLIRLAQAINAIGAKRVVLDTVEVLFSGFSNSTILRAELRRLFRWLKEREVTAIVTGEQGDRGFTRHGLEEYVADCVILLDYRVTEQIATRRLRIVKYRGSAHGSDECPFLIGERGLTVWPITSFQLEPPAPTERISSGVPRLDAMLGGQGYYRGSTILVSGTAGSGKTSLAATFVEAACRRGERCLYVAFEETANQIIRNMRSIGIDLEPWVKQGLLIFHTVRPTLYGLETHLVSIEHLVDTYDPAVVVLDQISDLAVVGSMVETKSMLTRTIDFLKGQRITALLTDLVRGGAAAERTNEDVSSLIDTWLLVRDMEIGGERNRGMYILKSRGMAHSNQIREFLLTDRGIDLLEVYLGQGRVLTGSARAAQEMQEQASTLAHQQELTCQRRELERKRQLLEMQLAGLRFDLETVSEEMQLIGTEEAQRVQQQAEERAGMARLRQADGGT